MSFAYFLLGCVLALATLAAYSPWAFRPFQALAGFTGMAVTLFLPHIVLLATMVSVGVWAYGGLQSTAGLVGLALHAGSAVALLLLQRRMNRALPRLDGRVIHDADTPFASLKGDFLPIFGPSLLLRTAVLASANVERGVEFRRVGARRLRLDVYRPPEGLGRRPAIVYVHGGGWVSGSRRQSKFMCAELAAAGFVVFAISYRLAPLVGMKDIVTDCKAGLAWVRAHQQQYGADERTLVMGGSAGGHLAAMLALTPNEPRFQAGFEDGDTSVDGAVVLYGVTDLTEQSVAKKDVLFGWFLRMIVRSSFVSSPDSWRELEPLHWAGPNAPPLLFVHGLSDAVVPLSHSKRLMAKLRESGAPDAHLLEMPLAHHAFEVMPTMMHQRAVRLIVGWCEETSASAHRESPVRAN